jgi:uncharacterized protein with HEPN domain
MSFPPLDYLRHILDEINYLDDQIHGLSKEEFLQDETLRRAFVRSLEIIGEATKKLPPEIREKHSHIDWRAMAGMRDRLIHNYFGVDYDIVWDVLTNKIPSLRNRIQKIIHDEAST